MKTKLSAVEYSSRYAVGLYYDQGAELSLPFKASYLKDDPVFRYIAVDNLRRNRRRYNLSFLGWVKFNTILYFSWATTFGGFPHVGPVWFGTCRAEYCWSRTYFKRGDIQRNFIF